MKVLSSVCIGAAVVIIILGIAARYYYPAVTYIRPANFLLIAQILLLLGINFAIMELLKKK